MLRRVSAPRLVSVDLLLAFWMDTFRGTGGTNSPAQARAPAQRYKMANRVTADASIHAAPLVPGAEFKIQYTKFNFSARLSTRPVLVGQKRIAGRAQ